MPWAEHSTIGEGQRKGGWGAGVEGREEEGRKGRGGEGRWKREMEEREGENSNSKTLFYSDCSLGSVKPV